MSTTSKNKVKILLQKYYNEYWKPRKNAGKWGNIPKILLACFANYNKKVVTTSTTYWCPTRVLQTFPSRQQKIYWFILYHSSRWLISHIFLYIIFRIICGVARTSSWGANWLLFLLLKLLLTRGDTQIHDNKYIIIISCIIISSLSTHHRHDYHHHIILLS